MSAWLGWLKVKQIEYQGKFFHNGESAKIYSCAQDLWVMNCGIKKLKWKIIEVLSDILKTPASPYCTAGWGKKGLHPLHYICNRFLDCSALWNLIQPTN